MHKQTCPNGLLLFSGQVVSDSFAIPWTVALQAPPSMGFQRQEYWSELLVPSLEDLPDPGIELRLCLTGRFFTTEPLGKQSFRTIATKTSPMSQVDQ